jgi:hypothetical protein
MRRVDHLEVRGVRHRGKAVALLAAGALAALAGCGMDEAYTPLDRNERDTVPELRGNRVRQTCSQVNPTAWGVAPAGASAVDLVRAGTAPLPPGADAPGAATSSTDLGSIDGVLDEDPTDDEPGRRAALEAGGFETGISTGFGESGIPHRIRALRFRDAAGALAHVEQRMVEVCRATSVVYALDDDGGVAFVDGSGRGAAVFVLGREEITLVLPPETEGDLIELLEDWHAAWLAAHATGPAQPVG